MQPRLRVLLPFVLLTAIFLLQWSLLMNISGPTWDAAFYYSYARSLAFDQDLSLANDLQLSYLTASPDFVARQLHANLTATGSVYAPFAIGSGMLWLPFLLLLRLSGAVVGAAPNTGFEWYIVAPVATLSALTGLISFFLAYRLTAREAGRGVALLSAATVSLASPLIYYQFREPLYAHVPSLLLNTIFLFAWWRTYRQVPSVQHGLLLGALLGLAALMRWQNAIYGVLPLVSAGWAWSRTTQPHQRQSLRALLLFLVALGATFLVVFSPQLLVWRLHYGSWLTIPQGGDFMTWRSPFLRQLLFSPFRGLLPWMPIYGLGVVGLVLQLRRKPRLVVPLIVLLALSTYVNASSRDWFAGGGYGPRRSAGELAIIVLGYAWMLRWLPERLRLPLGISSGALLALHQWLLLRFALVERIGGRVLSMAPNFEWAETTLREFVVQLASHLPDVVHDPVDVFIFPASPLQRLLQEGRLPRMHLFSLLVAAAFLTVCLLLADQLSRRWFPRLKKKAAQVSPT